MSLSVTKFITIILPGLLVAATGVGAGDLATASLTGSLLGTAVLWAVVVGALFKFTLTEGLARWQLATGSTFLEGLMAKGGRWLGWLLMGYLLLWSFFVGSALISATGIGLHALLPVFNDPVTGKQVFGVIGSLAGLLLVRVGGFRFFEQLMSYAIAVLFVSVLVIALLLWPGAEALIQGLFIPAIPDIQGEGLTWTIALMGGVGGTLTILCYGYWIRESGRSGPNAIDTCRIDLGVGYLATALFGMAMVVIGSQVTITGSGANLLVNLADRLETDLGVGGRWLFLIGAFCGIFSSLLGVWQAVPYLFADLWHQLHAKSPTKLHPGNTQATTTDVSVALRQSPAYRHFMVALALIPLLGLLVNFKEIQKLYAVIGACFMPLLALSLLWMNGRRTWLGGARNGWLTILALLATLAFFSWTASLKWLG